PKDALATARYVTQHYPQVHILARARNRTHAFDYMDLHIDAVRETFFSALRLGDKSLLALGFGPLQAHRAVRKFRKHDEAMLRESHPVRHDVKKMVEHSHRSREDLARLLQREFERPLLDEQPDGETSSPGPDPVAGG
ncbi:MAG TPA: glutathione-regulated potassium-efflux system protein KefC, partial [Methylophilaceae bacterium]|nr:glutathione-regulated potassium-efflux system protein KefC [Methylophilaceae bacterium]